MTLEAIVRSTNETLIPSKSGSYGKVTLVESGKKGNGKIVKKRGGFLSRFSGKREPIIPPYIIHAQTANSVILGTLSDQQLASFPKGNNEGDQEELANIVVTIVSMYECQKREAGPELKQSFDGEALVLSDFFEIMPITTAARTLLAISNPNIARSENIDSETIDTQQCAIKVVALLPQQTRLGIFREMARLNPEGAYGLFSLFASNWSVLLSDYCGQRFIEIHLPEDDWENKKDEVCTDLRQLGPELREMREAVKKKH